MACLRNDRPQGVRVSVKEAKVSKTWSFVEDTSYIWSFDTECVDPRLEVDGEGKGTARARQADSRPWPFIIGEALCCMFGVFERRPEFRSIAYDPPPVATDKTRSVPNILRRVNAVILKGVEIIAVILQAQKYVPKDFDREAVDWRSRVLQVS